MFVAASTGSFADVPFDEACRQLVDLEYDRVELWMSEAGEHLKPSTVAADPERFYAHYRELTRLTPVAICLEDEVDRDAFAEIARLAKLFRITQITLPAGPLGTPFNSAIDRLRTMLAVANENGIRLSIKTRIGHLTEDPHTAVELCQAVRGLGLTLDPSHYMCGPHRDRPYDQVFPHVYHVHLRDSTGDSVQVPVGLGEIDYSRLIAQLRRQGYEQALSVDLIADRLEPNTRPLEMRKLRMLLETLI
ncbi:MAG: sugar phosphate isomerase/epimerase [Planctomycetaceae bacterium]